MFKIHEGEILVKERYGASSNIRFYIKPPEQSNIVIIDEEKRDVSGWFTKLFLPQGYPDSVSKDYIAYQIWDTAQAFCSTITGTLATQEVLRGVGVGDTSATPLAATITWVFKDGCGHVGKILFAFSHGTYLDAYSKKWRLYADTLNDAAMCIEIALPLFKNYTTFALCVSTVMKAIVGVAGGATRAAMTQHHAIRGNMADVSAKDSAQETAVNLIASVAALLIITVFGNSLAIFLLMMVLHIVFNYFAVRAVCLRTLNEPRYLQVIDTYLKKEVLASPCDINRKEPIIFYHLGPNLLDLKLCGFQIKLGCSIKKHLNEHPKASNIISIQKIYNKRLYVIIPCINKRKMYVLIKDNATTEDILCAYFHAVLLSIIVCAINDFPLSLYQNDGDPRPFAQVCQTLQSAEWTREPASEGAYSLGGFNYEPTHDLIAYVDKIVQKEWRRVRAGLVTTGWDLSKHLLIVDEWRICTKRIMAEPIPKDKVPVGSLLDFAKIIPFGDVLSDFETEKFDIEGFTIEPEMTMSNAAKTSKLTLKPELETKKDKKAKEQKVSDAKTPPPPKTDKKAEDQKVSDAKTPPPPKTDKKAEDQRVTDASTPPSPKKDKKAEDQKVSDAKTPPSPKKDKEAEDPTVSDARTQTPSPTKDKKAEDQKVSDAKTPSPKKDKKAEDQTVSDARTRTPSPKKHKKAEDQKVSDAKTPPPPKDVKANTKQLKKDPKEPKADSKHLKND
ncbi:hypothetical protein ABMA27_000269 [Loxostege sticticalis]|uniref:Uncharacterized protein n=1 Tax=Loxostege sticticalis TaxID=481309 RepID=A0ABR3IMS2_LOXSC